MPRLILITAFALSAVSMRAQQVSYAYDANGNRTSRTVVLQTHAAKSMVQQKDTAFLYEHLAQQQLRIYPNPVKEELTIALDAYSTEHQGEHGELCQGRVCAAHPIRRQKHLVESD